MAAKRYTLWGWTSRWPTVTQPLRIEISCLRDCRARERQFKRDYPDALTGIYAHGDAPTGLALQVRERIAADAPHLLPESAFTNDRAES